VAEGNERERERVSEGGNIIPRLLDTVGTGSSTLSGGLESNLSHFLKVHGGLTDWSFNKFVALESSDTCV